MNTAYQQPQYSVSRRGARLELTHAASNRAPSDFTPSWVLPGRAKGAKGAYVNATVYPNGELNVRSCEWYTTEKNHTVSRDVSVTLDKKAAYALWAFLNENLPKVTP